MQTCIRPSWCHCHLLSLASVKSRLIFTFLVPAHPSSPEKRAVKRARVCMYFYGRSSFDKVYLGCSFFIQCRIRLILHCYIILYQLLPMRCYASLCSLATADICFLIPDHPCLLWINSHVVVCNVHWFFFDCTWMIDVWRWCWYSCKTWACYWIRLHLRTYAITCCRWLREHWRRISSRYRCRFIRCRLITVGWYLIECFSTKTFQTSWVFLVISLQKHAHFTFLLSFVLSTSIYD